MIYQISIKGYAVSGGGRGIERVDVSIDGGKTWIEASKSQKAGIPYISDDESSDKWAWVLFEAEAQILESTDIVAKAVSSTFIYITNISSFQTQKDPYNV